MPCVGSFLTVHLLGKFDLFFEVHGFPGITHNVSELEVGQCVHPLPDEFQIDQVQLVLQPSGLHQASPYFAALLIEEQIQRFRLFKFALEIRNNVVKIAHVSLV